MQKMLAMFAWAQSTLTANELSEFEAAANANNLLWKQYAEQGLISFEDIYENTFSQIFNDTITVNTGNRIKVQSNADVTLDSAWDYWRARFEAEVEANL